MKVSSQVIPSLDPYKDVGTQSPDPYRHLGTRSPNLHRGSGTQSLDSYRDLGIKLCYFCFNHLIFYFSIVSFTSIIIISNIFLLFRLSTCIQNLICMNNAQCKTKSSLYLWWVLWHAPQQRGPAADTLFCTVIWIYVFIKIKKRWKNENSKRIRKKEIGIQKKYKNIMKTI